MADIQPVLLIPALYCSARLFEAQIPALWGTGPITIANHCQGDSIAEIAAQVLANAPPRFALAGLSMGGYTALEIMRQAPERVTRLALLNTSARSDAPEITRGRLDSIRMVEREGFERYLDQSWLLAVAPARRDDVVLRALYNRIAWDVGPEKFIRQQQAIGRRRDSRPYLGAIRCPTWVLVGEDDLATPPHLAEEMRDAIAGAELRVIPRCGHLSTIERPEAVTQALLEWLSPAAG